MCGSWISLLRAAFCNATALMRNRRERRKPLPLQRKAKKRRRPRQESVLRPMEAGELVNRPAARLDTAAVSAYLGGACVLVTGGGGSIGAELCRQVARFAPARLIVFDICETGAYELYTELNAQYGTALCVEVEIGSVRDEARLARLFAKYRPSVVFHAAAYKHVPLMESNPVEAVQNNVDGTYKAAIAAEHNGTQRFVLISTDKAVLPASVMGATKYLCEQIVQYRNQRSTHTGYTVVRIGNVLDSSGSVLPLFRRQIAAGGPLTITHRDVTRYFMTIPDAAQRILQAGGMGRAGGIFLLDMGEPVRIDDLARSLIRQSGFVPDADIPIVYTGLRPGEKLSEDLLWPDETKEESGFPGIWAVKAQMPDAGEAERRVEYIRRMAEEDPDTIQEHIAKVVPGYRSGASEG